MEAASDEVERQPAEARARDFELAQKAAGDAEAFEQIYWRHHKRVYGICYRMTKNVSDAEDLTQQVFIVLFRKIGSFRGDAAFSTWLHRMTVNTVLMHLRKNKTIKEETIGDGELPEAPSVGKKQSGGNQIVDRVVMNELIGKLAKGYRNVLILHDVLGYEHEEIARLLGCSSGTSKSQLFKARQKLRRLLSSERGDSRAKGNDNEGRKIVEGT